VARRILHCDLDAFFVAVEQARRPELRGKPVIVGGDPGGRGVVATASYEARVFGVYSGMPLRTAYRLAPEAIFLRGNYAEYAGASKIFHTILDDYTPLVESGGLDEAYLDITGCEGIVGDAQAAAASIRSRVRAETELAVSVGIGTSKLIAKVASDKAKPDGVLEVLPGTEAAFLAPMPLRALPLLGQSSEKRLHQLGITTLGQLAAMPASALEGIFGPHGAVLGRRARGIDNSPVSGGEAQKSISREGTFSSDVARPAELRAVLRGFSESVGAQLRSQDRRARTVSLKLRFDDFTTISRSLTLKRPANSNETIFAAANQLLEGARAVDSRPIRLIGVGASNLVAADVQLALVPSRDERLESLSRTFDRVRTKYGRKSLQTGRTAFSESTSDDESVFDKNTGLSSQIKTALE
jgi:DNA polymerase-4